MRRPDDSVLSGKRRGPRFVGIDKEATLARARCCCARETSFPFVGLSSRTGRNAAPWGRIPVFRLIHSNVAFTASKFSMVIGQSDADAFLQTPEVLRINYANLIYQPDWPLCRCVTLSALQNATMSCITICPP